MKRTALWTIIFVLAFAAMPALGQKFTDVPDRIKKRNFYKRAEWFYKQRAWPAEEVPEHEYWRARADVQASDRVLMKRTRSDHITWQTLGPHGINALPAHWDVTSGRVRAIAVDPTDEDVLFIGAAAGGLWKSTNGGGTWTALGDDFASLTFGAIAVDPQDPQIVYAGSGEARFGFRTYIYDGQGLFKSTDGGATWTQPTTSFGTRTHFSSISVDPFNSDSLYASLGSGYIYLGNRANEGVWVSGDSGETWTATLALDDAFEVVPHPTRRGQVFAAIGGEAAGSSGVWISNTSGQTWTRRNTGLPNDTTISRIQISISTSAPATMYAVIFGDDGVTRAFRSTNSAQTWVQISPGVNLGGDYGSGPIDQGDYDLAIAVNPTDANDVWVGNVEFHRATDGLQFNPVRGGFLFSSAWDSPMHLDYHKIVYAPSDPTRIYVGNDGGIHRSVDGGDSWQAMNGGLNTIQFYRIASSPHDPDIIIGGAQDNGIMGIPNVNPGVNQRWNNLSTGDGMELFFHPNKPNVVYASTQNVSLYKSTNGIDGFNFVGIPTAGRITNGIPDFERNLNFFTPFVGHPLNGDTLFTGTFRPFRSTDGGDNWTAMSAAPLVDSTTTIQSIAFGKTGGQTMILAAGRQVFTSTNLGLAWTNSTGALPNRFISRVIGHPHKDSTFFAVVSGFGAGQKIYITPDLGVTWTNISGDLPNVPHNDLFVDPGFLDNRVMYTANDLGVFSTNDGGASWVREGDGMPIVPAIDFDYVFSQRILRVATHGRSAFQAQLPLSTIALVAPNGTKSMAVNANYDITWSGAGFSNPDDVRLEYSVDEGQNWTVIVASTENDGRYRWRVPNTPTADTTALVRVISIENESIRDQSNTPFQIFVDPDFAMQNIGPFTGDLGTFTSVSWGDYDGDGDIDAAVTSEHPTERQLRLYRNIGNNSFSPIFTPPIGTFTLQATASTWGDFDGDGDLDLFIATNQPPGSLFLNDGDGTFTDATNTVFPSPELVELTSASWVDFDRDNKLDLFVTTGGSEFAAGKRNILYKQTTPGQLVATYFDGEFDSRGQAWGDYNDDGYPDVYIVNHGAPNLLYKSVKAANGVNIEFERVLTGQVVTTNFNSNSASWADFDNDGDLDLFVANEGTNQLFRSNNFGISFSSLLRPPTTANRNSLAAAWGDFDNNGWLDLFVANEDTNALYKGVAAGAFIEVVQSIATTTLDHSNGAAWGDYDNDGDLDLLYANGVVGTSETERNTLLRNVNGEGNNWLQVRLRGVVSELTGLGAKVKARVHIDGFNRWLVRELTGQSGKGQNSVIAHFGLAGKTIVDSLVVEWPNKASAVRVLEDVDANQRITIYERQDQFVKSSGGALALAEGRFVATAWGDVNNDGFQDIFVANEGGDNALYLNDGSGRFTAVGGEVASDGSESTSGSFADIDNDGDLDLYVTNRKSPNLLYTNTGFPRYELRKTASEAAKKNDNSTGATWGDLNNDGSLDLFVTNTGDKAVNSLYLNDGRGDLALTTIGVLQEEGSWSGAHFVDSDADGDMDLFITSSIGKDVLFLNSGAGFTRVKGDKLVEDNTGSNGSSWADYDNDGDLDVYVIKNGGNKLYENTGSAFSPVTSGEVVSDLGTSRSSAWMDYGNDGKLDLLVTNDGFNAIYLGNADGTFGKADQSQIVFEPGSYFGASWADVNNDGDLDVVIPRDDAPAELFTNGLQDSPHWLQVQCIGTVSNRSAIGARVAVKSLIDPKKGVPEWQYRTILSQSGAGSQNSLLASFGLAPDGTIVDSLVIDWPSGTRQVLTDVDAGQKLVVYEPQVTGLTQDTKGTVNNTKFLVTSASWSDYDNDGDEDLFVTTPAGANELYENVRGVLNPTEGNDLTADKLASVASSWADFDNDGLLDLFVANAGDPSVLYVNNGGRSFAIAKGTELDKLSAKATGCSWGDLDNDGWVDLVITTSEGPNLIFMNAEGKDLRQLLKAEIVEKAGDTRSVAMADVDADGDLDVFFANYRDINALYLNHGEKGYERVVSSPLGKDGGRSVSASWGDYDNDGDPDLFVANEGEPDFLYRNDGGASFTRMSNSPVAGAKEISAGSSWADYDNDGLLDLFVTVNGGVNRFYRNAGGGIFTAVTNLEPVKERAGGGAVAWGNADSDGDADLFYASGSEGTRFFLNDGNRNNWLALRLKGNKSNQAGIGARVEVVSRIGGLRLLQSRQVSAQTGGGAGAQNSLVLAFGLGDASAADSIRIYWPSGVKQVLTGIRANRRTDVRELQKTTSVEENEVKPATFALYANYPNPFNPSTSIRYALPEQSQVRIAVYDLVGRQISELVAGDQQAGSHEVIWHAGDAPSGVYFYELRAQGSSGQVFRRVRKMILVK